MKVKTLRPWTELVKLHPDVESGNLIEAVFAIDLGAVAAGDPNVPAVYRDPDAFFAATYLTSDLRRLLEEVLASLAGATTYNRVLKLRSPFGGGKSHVLAALLHAARSRKSLDQLPECRKFADPGEVAVAVFDGEKFTATGDKPVGGGTKVHTMWGWLAWQLGPDAYQVVATHDTQRVAPAGDEIRALLEAPGKPVLLLLDEVLKYMERAGAVAVQDSTLQRQAKDFLQNLTVEVARSRHAVMVYSLQWSSREALGNVALLEELDHLTSRTDQVREPVTGDEVLAVVKRRLLAGDPPVEAAEQVAGAYADVVGGFWRARAENPSARQDAEERTLLLKKRMQAAYPFHPTLIDVMNGRWTSVDEFQRTRGALRFLATCLHSLKANGGARAILGLGEIPLADPEVQRAMLKDLDPTQAYDPVIKSDIVGPEARAKRIDERLAKETPALANVRPALRLATAILAYSFGGLKREAGQETVPPGVSEAELLAACVGPDLDSITAQAVLAELRDTCLYLHYDGVRYCFKKDPNITKLIEDAEQEVARDSKAIRERIREMLHGRLAGRAGVLVWPESSRDLPDREPRFLIGYMPLEFAAEKADQQRAIATEMFGNVGDRPRQYRNGLALAIPDKRVIESLRRAVRYLMAVDLVKSRARQLRLTPDQLEQLEERRRTELAAAETAFRNLYSAVWLPRVEEGGQLGVEKLEASGRPLQATGVHERVIELLTAVGTPKLHSTLNPRKIVEHMKLGEALAAGELPRMGVTTREVCDAFFSFFELPRIVAADVLVKAIATGVAEKRFGYVTGCPKLGEDGKYQVDPAKVFFGHQMKEDEVDLEDGFLIFPSAIPVPQPPGPCPRCGKQPCQCKMVCIRCGQWPCQCPPPPSVCPRCRKRPCVCPRLRTHVTIRFSANRDQVFKAFPAIANLADKSAGNHVRIMVEAVQPNGFDANWFRNAVQEPLDEADIEDLQIE